MEIEEPPIWFDVKVLDGAAVVHLLPTTNVATFEMFSFPTSRRICTLASMLALYGILTLLELLKSQQEGREEKEFKGRWRASRNKIPRKWISYRTL